MNFILYGPPRVGISTILGELKMRGQHAIDLADLYPNEERFKIPDLVDHCFIGACDLDPDRSINNARRILIIPETEEHYCELICRYGPTERDYQDRAHHLLSFWEPWSRFDCVIVRDPDDNTANIAEFLIGYFKQWEVGEH